MRPKDPTLLRQQCFVGGAWIGAAETPVTNPATGAVLAKVPRFGAGRRVRRSSKRRPGCCFRAISSTMGLWSRGLYHSNAEHHVASMKRLLEFPVRVIHGGHYPSYGAERHRAIIKAWLAKKGV